MKEINVTPLFFTNSPKSNLFIKDISWIQLKNLIIKDPSIINLEDEKGETLLSRAIKNNNNKIYDILIKFPLLNLNYKDHNGNSYLHLAVKKQNEKIVKILLKKGINLDMQNKLGNTALHLAFKYGNDSLIKILTNNGINTLIKNKQNKIASEIKPINFPKQKSGKLSPLANKNDQLLMKGKKGNSYKNISSKNNYLLKKNIENINLLRFNNNHLTPNPRSLIKRNGEENEYNRTRTIFLESLDKKIKSNLNNTLSKKNNHYLKAFKELNMTNNNEKKYDFLYSNLYDNISPNSLRRIKYLNEKKEKINNLDDDSSPIWNDSLEKIKTIYKSNYLKYDDIDEDKNINNINTEKWNNTIENKNFQKYRNENCIENDTFKYKMKYCGKNSQKEKNKRKNDLVINKTHIEEIDEPEISNNAFLIRENPKKIINSTIKIKNRSTNAKNKKEIIGIKQSKTLKKRPQNIKIGQNLSPKKFIDNELTMNSCNVLKSFLIGIDMIKYLGIFTSNGFDDLDLILEQSKNGEVSIRDSELREAGINIPGDRAKIIIRLQEISNNFSFPIPKEVYYTIKDKRNIENDEHINSLKIWLRNIKLENYIMNLIDNGYHSIELLLIQMASSNPITNEILKDEIGIDKVGYRGRFLNKLKEDSLAYVGQLKLNTLVLNNGENKHNDCQCNIF